MRILHLCDSFNPSGLGGYESYLYYLSKELQKQDHESFVVTQKSSRRQTYREYSDFYVRFNLSGNFLEARKWEFFSHPPEERIHLANSLFSPDDIEKNVEKLNDELSNVIDSVQPDVIHAHSTYIIFNRVLEDISKSKMQRQVPLLLTVHGLPKRLILPDGTETTDYQQLARHFPFDHVTAVSEHVRKELTRFLPCSAKIETLYLGIDFTVFKPMRMTKKWDAIFMGRWEPMKGVDLFPQMLAHLKKQGTYLKMAMTGDGSLRDTVLEEFENRDVADMIEFLGVVPKEEVPRILSQSRMFLYPSRKEPFGLSIVEAMACKTPVISTNAFGPTEIVTNSVDGLLVELDNPIALANAVSRLKNDDHFQKELAQKGYNSVRNRFDIVDHCKRLLNLYDKLRVN